MRGRRETGALSDKRGRYTTVGSSNIQFSLADKYYVHQEFDLDASASGYLNSTQKIARYGKLGGWTWDPEIVDFALERRSAEQDDGDQTPPAVVD